MRPEVRVARIYDPPQPTDGARLLVDGLWPRGMRKDASVLDGWQKQLAPSAELRRWYGHDPDRFEEFTRRYRAELMMAERAVALAELTELSHRRTVTLLTATKVVEISHAMVLADVIRERA